MPTLSSEDSKLVIDTLANASKISEDGSRINGQPTTRSVEGKTAHSIPTESTSSSEPSTIAQEQDNPPGLQGEDLPIQPRGDEDSLHRYSLKRARAAGFSGCDISATIFLPPVQNRRGTQQQDDGVVYQLGAISTLSYDVYTAKTPSRALGFKGPKGFARGSYTVAGNMIFNTLNTNPLDDTGSESITLINDEKGILTYSSGSTRYVRQFNSVPDDDGFFRIGTETPEYLKRHMFDFSLDQRITGRRLLAGNLPPFDIICTFVNEVGNIGKLIIYGVEIVQDSAVLSVEDIYTENRYTYIARDIEAFHAVSWEQTQNWASQIFPNIYQAESVIDDSQETARRLTDRAFS